MNKVVPYSVLKKKRREKKYGTDASRIRRLKAMGYPDEVAFEIMDADLDCFLYGESEEEEEDYWLGENNLCKVIK